MKNNTIQRKELKDVDIRPMFPNMVTMGALASGLSALQFAFWGNWSLAVAAIALAAVFDGLDGRVARMLKTSSRFGAELDSLSDLVSFGVAPGFILYRWTMEQGAIVLGSKDPVAIGAPWVFALFLAMCCALRLARFNTMLDETPQPPYWTHFFVGLPAPGGAYVALLPLVLWLWTGIEWLHNSYLVVFFMVVSAILMASRIPTPCFKKVHLPKMNANSRQIMMVVMVALIAAIISMLARHFWAVISIMGLIYIVMLPLGIAYFLKQKKSFENK